MPYPSRTVEYERHRNRMIAYGRWQPYVSAARSRTHVLDLMRHGIGPVTIARESGVPHGAISKLIYGDYTRGLAPSKRVRPDTEARLLAVQPSLDLMAPSALVRGLGTHRRIQALCALGWSVSEQARRLDRAPGNLHKTLSSPSVQACTARAVNALYGELSMTPGPSQRARVWAQTNRWPPPLGWDDIDDPEERPSGWEHVPDDRASAVRHLAICRYTLSEAADLIGTSAAALKTWCYRHGLAEQVRAMEGAA